MNISIDMRIIIDVIIGMGAFYGIILVLGICIAAYNTQHPR